MSWLYRHLIRPALFAQNPEQVHNRTLRCLGWTGRHPLLCGAIQSVFGAPELPSEVFGLRFPNPLGLAAGMDKHAQALLSWEALGFGFTELGAVTWHPQPGNPSPRVFRAVADEAIINRMGFNNPGAEAVAQTLAECRSRNLWPHHPVGMNLGKSKITPLEKAAEDYANSFRVLRPYLDFFVVNVSSPNTPNLRQLQDKAALEDIFAAIQSVQSGTTRDEGRGTRDETPPPATGHPSPVTRHPLRPVLVKIAPDLSFEALDQILELTGPRQIAGIVATNTTLSRPQTARPDLQHFDV